MKAHQKNYWFIILYIILTSKSATLEPQNENPNAQSVSPPEGPKRMVRPDQVKSVIDDQNSLTKKISDTSMDTFDTIQKAGTSTINNLGWFTTSLLSNTLKILSNTMQAVKSVGNNTISAGVRVGKNTAKIADGAVRGALGFAKSGARGLENQLTNASTYFKDVSKNPPAVSKFIPIQIPINTSAILSMVPASNVTKFLYDANADSLQTIYNTTLSSGSTIGWLATDTLADTIKVLGNTLDLVENLGDTTITTGYKLGANGAQLAETVVGGGYNYIENGLSLIGNQMENMSNAFKERIQPQRLVDVPLTETQTPRPAS